MPYKVSVQKSMKLSQPLIPGTLIQRYKRFLADVKLDDGQIVTAHCPNSGSMLTCSAPGSAVLLSKSNNPKRKYPLTWELIYTNQVWVGINTQVPNCLVYETILSGDIPELAGYNEVRREVPFGKNSRVDLLLSIDSEFCYVEIKNVTFAENDIAYFPDAVTTRGAKHLRELMAMKRLGHRAVMFYLIQRADCSIFKFAEHIDPVYTDTLRQALSKGVEALIYQADVSPLEITLGKPISTEF